MHKQKLLLKLDSRQIHSGIQHSFLSGKKTEERKKIHVKEEK